ncbi:AAA family ATPase [Duganella sp. Root1480D1]|uniref:AAA family ATPase n=1 Tax=Duganella sp. Root1480D1 TaxID=1736471 RepID=UPI000AEE1300|nr:AAA family ATPase [Duganella sp. Root1480D1]
MTIRSIKLDKTAFDNSNIGLSELPLDVAPLHLHSLGQVVVVAGANGAGKSRLLRLIQSLASKVLPSATVEDMKRDRENNENMIRLQLVHKEAILNGSIPLSSELEREKGLANIGRNLARGYQAIERIDRALCAHTAFQISPAEPFQVIEFVPRVARLVDASHTTDHDARQRAESLTHGGSANAEQNAPAYARSVLRAAMRSRDRARAHGDNDKTAERAETSLREIVRNLLGEFFWFELNNDLNLCIGREGTSSYASELSQGQQVLFQLACMLHAQGDRLQGSVILMDEPENHLHPAVLNEVVNRLRLVPGFGQLWLATHSVPLIAHMVALDPDCLWYAEAGSFKRAGRTPMKVLESLMGGSKGSADLQALTRLPAEYAALKFLSECLVEPGVVGPDTKDPQTNQIVEIISELAKSRTRALRIVDFGAGVGRLLTTVAALANEKVIGEFVDYLALEHDREKHKQLQREICAVYGTQGDERIFLNERELSTRIDGGSVDCIVMCNVLHEISPDDWILLFSPEGPMMTTLAEDGYLLFVEDYGIPIGERAHRYGFLLLDEGELKTLFKVTEMDRMEKKFVRVPSSQERYRERLVAHLVSKSCAERVSAETRRKAIQVLCDRTKNDVKAHLEAPPSSEDSVAGRDYARNAQLYSNASIWLSVHGVS